MLHDIQNLQPKAKKGLTLGVHIIFSISTIFILIIMALIFTKYILGTPTQDELDEVMDPKKSLLILAGFQIITFIGWFIMLKVTKFICAAQNKVINKLSRS